MARIRGLMPRLVQMSSCWYCNTELAEASQYCPSCGHSQSDHTSSPLFGVVDPITGIWNSKFVNALVGQEANRAVRYHRPLSLLVIELDHAEHIHKELGQIQIDGLLREMSERLGRAIRDTDTVGFLDADDLWAANHPQAALDYLQSHDVDLVFGQTQCFIAAPTGPAFHTYQLGSAVCRRRLIDRIGGFNSQMRHGEDVDWFLRARDSGAAIARLPDVSLYFRMHAGNRPNVYQTSRGGLLSALHQSLQRRRSAN